MTTTLQNGTKIPDKYSRDWYADLSNNWNLLDSLIGQVASGTFQHDVIPSTTGTYKLGSSTNVWDAVYGNAYFLGTTPFGDIVTHNASEFAATSAIPTKTSDLDNDSGYISNTADCVHLAGAETITGDKTFTGAVVTHNITPETDNTYSLGSSTLAWSAVYANTYYYGGTEFSDKFWTADTVQSFTVSKHLRAYNLKVGQGETYGRTGYSLVWTDKNDVPVGYIDSFKNANAARTVLRIQAGDYYTSGTPDSEGTQVIASLRVGTLANSTRVIEAGVDAVYPTTNNATDLGTSSNKWKTLNGINPGMLSFPANSYVDIDTTGWTAGGTNRVQINGADPTYPGWLFVRLSNIAPATDYCLIRLFGTGIGDMSICGAHSDKHIMVFAPVPANTAVRVYCSVLPAYCRYYPCLGNV